MIPEYLYHYYETSNGSFQNITQNGYEKAVKIQGKISEGWNSKRPSNYIELRFALEKRLRDQFISKGGKPTRDDPFYFTLGECKWAKSWYINPGVVKIPLSDFSSEHISFTYPDSMVSFQFNDEPKLATYRKGCNGQVFLLSELSDLISEYGLPSEEKSHAEERLKYDKYIEAQVWDDSIIEAYKAKLNEV
ncbi:hypothetical protein [Tunicatimonas pelagia]|uniref:hypothetical protein n=1 Tax=Tunicatimonas pelagia TaxID=931531 RepID=UPI0026659CFD|nr:hypothetical protein [Tunicatimonas pelagia]WKN45809.1 hypothetical protein P0M28_12655 [Tunicatimonas pelagia]